MQEEDTGLGEEQITDNYKYEVMKDGLGRWVVTTTKEKKPK